MDYDEYFEKKFVLRKTEDYQLPLTIFESPKWTVETLQVKKQKLNEVKSMLGKYKLKAWSKHTAYRDHSGFIMKRLTDTIHPELLTQAWCKFYEILNQFSIVSEEALKEKKCKSLHLCEAPGAFICALNQFLVSKHPDIKWNWLANTLNPNYEGNEVTQMIPDDRLIRYTLRNWYFGVDFTGDITRFYNFMSLIGSDFCQEKLDLITADGSIDCMKDPGEQERIVEYLHFCETIVALALLKTGGTFVIKIFTTFEDTTINLIYLLNYVFEELTIFKPCTSKGGNSEVYLVNLRYKGHHHLAHIWPKILQIYNCGYTAFGLNSMFNLDDLPISFLEDIHRSSDFYNENQIKTILDNIYHFENNISDNIYVKKKRITQLFFKFYEPVRIPEDRKLVPYVNVGGSWRIHSVYKDIHVIPRKAWFYCSEFNNGVLDMKVGEQIEMVRNTMFTNKDNLQKLSCSSIKKNSQLYDCCLRALNVFNVVINVTNFDLKFYHKFQKAFFNCVNDSLKENKNIVFINVPFVTHFLVGLLFVLCHGFQNTIVGNGYIILYGPESEQITKVKNVLNSINFIYKDIENKNSEGNKLYFCDIVQLVDPMCLDKSLDFLEILWNYNNRIFASNASYLRPFNKFELTS